MVIDLKEKSGLGLRFDIANSKMFFGQDIQSNPPAIRTIDQLQEVLLDKHIREPRELYYMYRDIYRLSHKHLLVICKPASAKRTSRYKETLPRGTSPCNS